jgi:hypothetical protein
MAEVVDEGIGFAYAVRGYPRSTFIHEGSRIASRGPRVSSSGVGAVLQQARLPRFLPYLSAYNRQACNVGRAAPWPSWQAR